jgi:hypothetical protein
MSQNEILPRLWGLAIRLAIAEFKQARELFNAQGKTQEATQIDQ